jgi:hypothetical protein
MKTVTVSELLILDKKRFEKEYYSWHTYTPDYEWWDTSYEDFKAKCRALGIAVDDITFNGFYTQGSSAAFCGTVDVGAYMEQHNLTESYPALYLAVKDDGSYVRISTSHRGNMSSDGGNECANQTAPSGVFSDLPQEDWEELVEEQASEACLEDGVLAWCNDLASGLYYELENEYEYLTSEESFIESCECNEITFEIETEEEES